MASTAGGRTKQTAANRPSAKPTLRQNPLFSADNTGLFAFPREEANAERVRPQARYARVVAGLNVRFLGVISLDNLACILSWDDSSRGDDGPHRSNVMKGFVSLFLFALAVAATGTCVYRNLNPGVVVMKFAKDCV